MKKLLLGFAAAAAVAAPMALTAGSASAATIVSTDPACSPVKDAAARSETFYKYVPVKSSDGPTQWDTVPAPAGTPKTWIVKGKLVEYVRDGNKVNIIQHPAIEGV